MKFQTVLILALLIFFSIPLATRSYYSPADILQSWWPFRTPDHGYRPANGLLSDIVTQMEPWLKFSREQLRAGSFPLWNPYSGAGVPHFANLQSTVLFPLNYFFYLLPWRVALIAAPFLKLYLIGLFTYLYLRSLGLNGWAATFGAVNFAFIGFNTFWLKWPLSNLMIFLPLLLLFAERFARERPGRWTPFLLALTVGAAGLAGHIETLLHILLLAGVYLAWRLLSPGLPPRARLRRLVLFILFAGLGIGIASVQLVPFLEYMFMSAAYAKRAAYAGSPYWQPLPASILNLIPDFYGNPADNNYFAVFTNYCMSATGFAGATSVFLALLAFFSPARKSRYARFYLLLAATCFCLVYKVEPIYRILTSLPLLNVADNSRLLFCIGFSVSVLAALFIQSLTREPSSSPGPVAVVSCALAVAGVAAWLALANKSFFEAHGFPFRFRHNIQPTILFIVSIALGASLLLLRRGKRGAGWCAGGLLLLIFLQTGGHAMKFNPSIPPKLFYPVPESIRYLRTDASVHRCLFVGGTFFPNLGVWYGIQDPRNYDAMGIKSYRDFQKVMGDFEGLFQVVGRADENMAGFINVKYLVGNGKLGRGLPSKTAHPENYRLVYSDASAYVYENSACLPRAFTVPRVRVVDSEEDLLGELPALDFRTEALVTDRDVPLFVEEKATQSPCEITSYRPRRVEMKIDARGPCYLVMSDSHFPGWKAFLDGQEVKIYKANGSFRLVPILGAGRHELVFRYNPLSFTIGIALSLACLATAAIFSRTGLFFGVRSRHWT